MAGSLTLSTLSDGTNSTSATNAIRGSARAWVNFNGTGTVAIRDSFNVSSITDNGTGQYTVNFTTPMPNANYGASVCVSGEPTISDANFVTTDQSNTVRTNPTTSAFTLSTFRYQGSSIDITFVRVTIFSS